MTLLTCGAVTLRPALPADDGVLVSLLPVDFEHDPTFPHEPGRTLAEHREAWLRHWLHELRQPVAGDRMAAFVVEHDGRLVGLQTLEGEGFDERREVESTSFLVATARGRRLGVAMRTAVLAFAFEFWGAARATTSSRPDNVASRRVAERVGYAFVARDGAVDADSPRPLDTWEMTAERWRCLDHLPVTADGVPLP